MTKHNHGAAVSGATSERNFSAVCKELGLTLLNKKKKGKQHEVFLDDESISLWGKKWFKYPSPYENTRTKSGKEIKKYIADGFIKELGVIMEIKNSDKDGTTEEKVFYDLWKIENGVYGSEHELWYLFMGKSFHEAVPYCIFREEAKRRGLNVKVIWGMDEFINEVIKCKKQKEAA